MDEDPRVHIIRRPPQPNKRPLRHDPQLVPKWRRELFRGRGLTLPFPLLEGLSLDLRDFVQGVFEFLRLAPQLRPIPISNSGGKSGTDGIEDVLGWVHVVWTDCTVTSEVFADNR